MPLPQFSAALLMKLSKRRTFLFYLFSFEEEKTLSKQKSNLMSLKEEATKYDLKDFEVLKELGEGQFGTVYLVTTKDKKRFYALKCISKYETLKCKLENHLKVNLFLIVE